MLEVMKTSFYEKLTLRNWKLKELFLPLPSLDLYNIDNDFHAKLPLLILVKVSIKRFCPLGDPKLSSRDLKMVSTHPSLSNFINFKL